MLEHELAALATSVGLAYPVDGLTPRERRLWARLVALQGAGLRVLLDVDDDGVSEAHDVAVGQLRAACTN
jgi:hypothetical protein